MMIFYLLDVTDLHRRWLDFKLIYNSCTEILCQICLIRFVRYARPYYDTKCYSGNLVSNTVDKLLYCSQIRFSYLERHFVPIFTSK